MGRGGGRAVGTRRPDQRRRGGPRHSARALHDVASQRHDRGVDLGASRQGSLAPYLHLPVQSGSDRVLASMNRGHGRAITDRSSNGCAVAGRTSRSPPISSSAIPARATPNSPRRSIWRARSASPRHTPSNIRPARARRRPSRRTRSTRAQNRRGWRRCRNCSSNNGRPSTAPPWANDARCCSEKPGRHAGQVDRPHALSAGRSLEGALSLIGALAEVEIIGVGPEFAARTDCLARVVKAGF